MSMANVAAMLAGWMTTSLLTGVLLGGLAWLLQRVVREHIPARLVWSVALFGTVVLGLGMPLRQPSAEQLPTSVVIATAVSSDGASDRTTWLTRTVVVVQRAAAFPGTMSRRIASGAAASVQRAPRTVHLLLVLMWPLASIALLVTTVLGYRRQLRRLLRGEQAGIDGTPVILTERIGPSVIGVRAPRIVIPRWLLNRPVDERALVLAHEQSHVEARDPLLLLVACGAVVGMPWNASLWWMLSRLRLAIELDCDRRVLARGVATRRYGELLVELSAAPSGTSRLAPIPAFSFHTSHLERRLMTMTARPTAHSVARRTFALLVGSTGLLAACGAELPTSAELEGMDVAAAERRLTAVAPNGSTAQYIVDGKEVSATDAKALGADRIASIDVKRVAGNSNVISIRTRKASTATSDTSVKRIVIEGVALRADGTADTTRRITMSSAPSSQKFEGLIYIDGVKSSSAAMNAISPDRIVSVEVIKGAAAEAKYGPEGAKGVIHITTRK